MEGEFLLYKSIDVQMWIKSRVYANKNSLPEKDRFVVMNDDLEKQYDAFCFEIQSKMFLPENELLHFWYKQIHCAQFTIVEKYGERFFELTPSEIDSFYLWITTERSSRLPQFVENGKRFNITYFEWF